MNINWITNAMATTITPEMAAEILKCNTNNRHVHQKKVKELAELMRDGRFRLNGETIIVSRSGRLVDGQHRLLACVMSGVSIKVFVVMIDEDHFDTIDIGVKRTPGDILSIANFSSANVLASAIKNYVEYTSSIGMQSVHGDNVSPALTRDRIRAIAEEGRAEWEHIIHRTMEVYRSLPAVIPSVVGGCYKMFNDIDSAACDRFMDKLRTGEGLQHGDPVLTLRNAWITRSVQKTKEKSWLMNVKMVYAWNAMRDGRKLTIVKHMTGNPIPAPR